MIYRSQTLLESLNFFTTIIIIQVVVVKCKVSVILVKKNFIMTVTDWLSTGTDDDIMRNVKREYGSTGINRV